MNFAWACMRAMPVPRRSMLVMGVTNLASWLLKFVYACMRAMHECPRYMIHSKCTMHHELVCMHDAFLSHRWSTILDLLVTALAR